MLQMTLPPNCCLTLDLFDVKRECIIRRGQNLWHKVCALRLMLTVSTVKSSASQEDHLFSVISASPSTAEKHSSKIPCQGVESRPERA